MTNYKKLLLAAALLLLGATGAKAQTTLYRLDRPGDRDVLLTGSPYEMKVLVNAGWKLRGPIGKVRDTSASFEGQTLVPLYRITNLTTGRKLFTINESEKNTLIANGWAVEATIGYVPQTAPSAYVRVDRYSASSGVHAGAHIYQAAYYKSAPYGGSNYVYQASGNVQNMISASFLPTQTVPQYQAPGPIIDFQLEGTAFYLYSNGFE